MFIFIVFLWLFFSSQRQKLNVTVAKNRNKRAHYVTEFVFPV